MADSDASIDAAFVRRAVELADTDAVRLALYHNTRDSDIASLPKAAEMTDEQRAWLIDRAVAWLLENAGPRELPAPPEEELRDLLRLATKSEFGDLEFEARREMPAFSSYPWYTRWPKPERPPIPPDFKVVVIGSGFCGIAMGVQLELLGIPYLVLDRQPEAGGTWTINRYPGIRVDTMSITYEFSFERNYPWSEYFGQGEEVRGYLDHIARKYGVHANTRFEHELRSATFDPDRDMWVLDVATPSGRVTLEANVIVNAVGTFANPRRPTFDGQDDFAGVIVHPARWPADLELDHKRVAVVGNGSTGVQMVKPISEVADHVFVFQRTPQWISPRPKYGAPIEPEIRWLLDNFPGYWNWWRYMANAALFETHRYLIPDEHWQQQGGIFNQANDELRAALLTYIEAETGGDPDLMRRVTPDYAPFSRRPVVDNGWYRALRQDHVDLVTDPIARLVPRGIQTTDGAVHDADVIVTATGFEVARYLWPAHYIGRSGVDIHDVWSKDGARAYLGMMVPDFPNMFMLYGPNSQPLSGGTSLPIWFVIWASYAGKCIVEMLDRGGTRVEVEAAAFERYNRDLDAEASKLLLMQDAGAPDKNYYVNPEFKRLQVNAPWYGPEYQRMCTYPNWDEVRIS